MLNFIRHLPNDAILWKLFKGPFWTYSSVCHILVVSLLWRFPQSYSHICVYLLASMSWPATLSVCYGMWPAEHSAPVEACTKSLHVFSKATNLRTVTNRAMNDLNSPTMTNSNPNASTESVLRLSCIVFCICQVQAIVVGLLAAVFAIVLGWVPEGKVSIIHGCMLCASSVLTAAITSFVLG